MSFRKIISLSLFFTFVLLALTSVVLYIRPEGRVAYWADWHLLWLDKPQWDALHLNIGLLFLLALILHIWLNRRLLVSCLRSKWRHFPLFNGNSACALLVCLLVAAGTILRLPPMSYVLSLNQLLKTRAAELYGEPPYGHAELSSLKMICIKQDIDPGRAVQLLEKNSLVLRDTDQSIKEIARINCLTPQQVYEVIRPAGKEKAGVMPLTPPPGTGRKTLSDIAEEYDRDADSVRQALAAEGVDASLHQSLLQVAEENRTNPIAVYEILLSASENSGGGDV